MWLHTADPALAYLLLQVGKRLREAVREDKLRAFPARAVPGDMGRWEQDSLLTTGPQTNQRFERTGMAWLYSPRPEVLRMAAAAQSLSVRATQRRLHPSTRWPCLRLRRQGPALVGLADGVAPDLDARASSGANLAGLVLSQGCPNQRLQRTRRASANGAEHSLGAAERPSVRPTDEGRCQCARGKDLLLLRGASGH